MKQTESWKSIILCVVLPISLVFIIEPFYRDSLFNQTLQDVPHMQQKKRLHSFFSIITFLGEAYLPLIVLALVYNLTNKMSALYIVSAFGFICYLNT